MDKQSRTYQAYVQILKEELIPAMGCTEPIAIAYAAAKARDVLGGMPDKVEIGVSSNIIKNVKSVIVPNTDGMKGIEAAAAAGIVGGQADKALEVIAAVTADQKAAMRAFLKQVPVTVKAIDNGFIFDIIVTLRQGSDSAVVRICQYHTNIVLIQRNSEVLLDHTAQETKQLCGDAAPAESGLTDRTLLNIADIFAFADTCEINDIRLLLETQIRYNTRISEEGLRGDYGANIGSTMLKFYGEDVRNRAIAKAAAGSDARMSGCELPVVINSGSGNQGITVSVPVIEYARELGASDETLCRALALSNLIAIHEKARYRAAVRLLRGRQRGLCCGLRHCLSAGRRPESGLPHPCQCAGHRFGYYLRWCQGQLCGEDRLQRGGGHPGVSHVQKRPAVPQWGWHRHKGR